MARRSRPRKTESDEEMIVDGGEDGELQEEAIDEGNCSETEDLAMEIADLPRAEEAEASEKAGAKIDEKVILEMNSWAKITEEEQKVERSTYASVVEGKQGGAGWGLKYVEPKLKEGKVVITKSEFDAGSSEWENTLVGFVIGRRPSFMEMKRYIQNQWRMEMPKFSMLGNGVCLFTFSSEKQKMNVLNRGWTFFCFPLVVKQWKPEMDLESIQVNRIPVWIRLPKLHLSLWNPMSIGKIVSAIGIPVSTDELTAKKERLDFARVMVEMEVRDDLPTHIQVEVEGETILQEVIFEWNPQRCGKCSKYGHASAQCRSAPKPVWKEKEQQKEKVEEKGEKEEAASSAGGGEIKSKAQEKKEEQKIEILKRGAQKRIMPPKPTTASKTPVSKGKGVEENAKLEKAITLKSPGVVVVQLGVESTQKGGGGANEFDNQGMQIAGGGKLRSKRK